MPKFEQLMPASLASMRPNLNHAMRTSVTCQKSVTLFLAPPRLRMYFLFAGSTLMRQELLRVWLDERCAMRAHAPAANHVVCPSFACQIRNTKRPRPIGTLYRALLSH